MPIRKRPLQDIVAPPSRPQRFRRNVKPDNSSRQPFDEAPIKVYGDRNRPRFSIWVIAGLSIIILGFAVSVLFSGARVTITPKQQNVLVDAEFVAFAEALPGELEFEVVTIEKFKSKSVTATGEETVEERAAGTIIVFNEFSGNSQRLITNTRFEAPDGRIYRIAGPVMVPGQSVEDGEVIPGSIEVEVFAEEAGEKYNAPLMDFTIPGFKGYPQYESFYARSKTPMTGGFIGKRLTIDNDTAERILSEIESELIGEVSADIVSQVPEGFILADSPPSIVFEELPSRSESGTVVVQGKVTLYGVLFDMNNLANYIAENTIAGFDKSEVYIQNLDELEIMVRDESDARTLSERNRVSVSINGDAKIIWQFDEKAFANDLAGKDKDAIPTIINNYPGIHSGDVSLWPLWKGSFPKDPQKIKIVLNLIGS